MKNSQRAILALEILFVLAVACAPFVFGDGMIIPIVPDQPYPLVLNHHVNITINGEHAVVNVDQEFKNDCDYVDDGGTVIVYDEAKSDIRPMPRPPPNYYCRDIEGTYVFPVPEGGVKDFSLVVGGKVLEGNMLDAETAKKIYQENAIARKEASLLSYVGKDTFAASVSIPKGETVRVRVTYEQEIKSSYGLNELFYPLSTERYTTKPIDPVDLRISIINTNGDIGFIYSPTYNVTIDRDLNGQKNQAQVTYYSKEIPDRDFVLYYGVTGLDYDVKLISNKKAGSDGGYFMLFLYPTVTDAAIVPKDVVFVIDTSGSMSGTKIEQAKSALKYSLARLNDGDKFGIVTFNNEVDYYNSEMQDASGKDAASAYVSSLEAGGSTNIYGALGTADEMLAKENDGRLHVIVLLTDGQDTTGHSNEMIIAAMNNSDAKLFPFGVGEQIDFELLDKLANAYGDGIPTYIRSDDQLETVMKNFVDRISRPLLTDVTVEINTPGLMDSFKFTGGTSDVLPKKIPSIFAGSQVVLVGRYTGSGMAPIYLKGKVGGEEVTKTYYVKFENEANNAFVERAWATRKVGYLLDQITIDGETPELKAEITELATKYGIPTPYTSYVVTTASGQNIMRDLGISEAAPQFSYGGTSTAGAAYKSAGTMGGAQNYAQSGMQIVDDKTFISADGTWSDITCGTGSVSRTVTFGSDEYRQLSNDPNVAKYLAAGDSIVLCTGSEKIAITPSGAGVSTEPVNVSITTGASGLPEVKVTGAGNAEKNPLGWLGQLVPIGVVLVFCTGFVLYQIMFRRPQMVELQTYKVLSSDTRQDILQELLEGDRTPTDLSSKLGKSKSTVVEHLDKMVEAGMIEKIERPGKKFVFYKLTRKGKDALRGNNGTGIGG
ncbi:von Willebrand factor type A domain protein [Candidatus Gugararchaeum adminiculabundum]|nr:von Willebrand factor type A domain protein [Candidatus Gugararchaeum adminiculabundum]